MPPESVSENAVSVLPNDEPALRTAKTQPPNASPVKLVRLNTWLQVLANLGVVAGLLFLGLQLRQNSRMMAAQTRNELTQSIITLIQMESDPRVVAAHLKRDAGVSLTPEDTYHLEAVANATLRHWENTFYQHRNGLFDNTEYEADTQVWAIAMQEPAYQSHWKKMRNTYSRDFREVIDRHTKQQERSQPMSPPTP